MSVYLDYNATSPINDEVLESMIKVYRSNYGNAGSRTHSFGQNAKVAVEKAREQVASILGVQENEIIFTSGATESDNLAILGLAAWGQEVNRKHIISTQIEHKAVLEPLRFLSENGFEVELVGANRNCQVNPEDLLSRVRPDTLLVSVMHVNNETGVIQPVHRIGQALKETQTYFHVDAAQSFGKLVPELKGLDYDLLSVSGHKIYAPQGIGALVTRRRAHHRPPLKPLFYGGGQENGLRPGTQPVALIAGLGKAAELAEKCYAQWNSINRSIMDSILVQLKDCKYYINGSIENSVSNCLNICFPGVDSEALMLALKNEIAISNGSACTSSDYKPSHVLRAMGIEDSLIENSVRLSWGVNSGEIDLSRLVSVVKEFQLGSS
jgi:cysteine desulfurase